MKTSTLMILAATALTVTMGCGPDSMAKAKTALEKSGYTNIELKKSAGSYDEIHFSANKGDNPCTGRVVIIRGTVDVQATCRDAKAEAQEKVAAAATPIAQAEKGCTDGVAKDCFEYGRLLVEGPPGDRNLKKARTVHTKNCAERKNLDSCTALGQLHARAIGGKQDNDKAIALFDDACKKDHAKACAFQGRLAFVDQNYKEARGLFDKACKGGSHAGCNGLGTLLKQGKGGKEDMEAARKLFDDACDSGYQEACSNMGVMLVKGQGGKPNKDSGKALLKGACKADVGVACHQLKKLGLK